MTLWCSMWKAMAVSVSVKNSKTANSNKNNYQSLGFSLYECLWSVLVKCYGLCWSCIGAKPSKSPTLSISMSIVHAAGAKNNDDDDDGHDDSNNMSMMTMVMMMMWVCTGRQAGKSPTGHKDQNLGKLFWSDFMKMKFRRGVCQVSPSSKCFFSHVWTSCRVLLESFFIKPRSFLLWRRII